MSGQTVEFPTGVVTLMFSDIEGSCDMWEELQDDAKRVLDKHNALIRASVAKHHGWEVKSEGDAFMVAFSSARDALQCAVDVQRRVADHDWSPSKRPIRVRIGLHSGEPIVATHPDGSRDYFGPMVNRAARIASCAHGGQLVISLATRELAGRSAPDITLVDLKHHRLKGLGEAEQLFQVNYDAAHTKFPPLRTLNAVRHNLPVLLTSFVGRAKEIEEIRALLMRPGTRLVTLHGFSGTGKTRLAQHVAAEVAVPRDDGGAEQPFPDGVWFIELIGFNSAEQAWQAVARVMTVPLQPSQDVKSQVLRFAAEKRLLLVLDNCELIEQFTPAVSELLLSCPNVKCIVTSQKVLGVAGEKVYQVPPLPLPAAGDTAALLDYDSVVLFAERAKDVSRSFEITPDNAPTLLALVRKLDGLPLAIELAAARVGGMGLKQILARIHNLPARGAALHPRQQTLVNMINWSFQLLNEGERALLLSLSTFQGSFTWEAAEAVCGDCAGTSPGGGGGGGIDVVVGLEELHNKSLLTARETGADVRYAMLEMIRSFCADELRRTSTPQAIAALGRRHAEYFIARAKHLNAELHTNPDGWKLMELDLANARAALGWARAAGEHAMVAELALALCPFFARRGYSAERLAIAEAGLEAATLAFPPVHLTTAALLHQLGWCQYDCGQYEQARQRLTASIAMRELLAKAALAPEERLGNDRWLAYSLNTLALLAKAGGDLAEGKELATRAMELMRRVDDPRGMAIVLNDVWTAALKSGNYEEAQAALEESLRYAKRANDHRCVAQLRNNLGIVSERRGNLEQAEHWYEQARAELEEAGDPRGAASCIANLARLARARGRLEEAAAMAARSLHLRRESKDRNGVALSLVQLSSIRIEQLERAAEAERAEVLAGAKALAEEALAIWTDMKNPAGEAQALLQLTEVLFLEGRAAEAAPLCARACTAAQNSQDQRIVVEAHIDWAKCAVAMADLPAAIALLRRARRLLWQSSPVAQVLARAGAQDAATPPKEVRRLVEVLLELASLHERQHDLNRAGWCLYVAARLAAAHPSLPSQAQSLYLSFCDRYPIPAVNPKRWGSRIKSPPRSSRRHPSQELTSAPAAVPPAPVVTVHSIPTGMPSAIRT